MKNLLKKLEKEHLDIIKELKKIGFVCEDKKGDGYPAIHLIEAEVDSVSMKHDITQNDIFFQLGRLEILQDIILVIRRKKEIIKKWKSINK